MIPTTLQRPGPKLLLLALLALAFAVPLAMVRGVTDERHARSEAARAEVARQWGAVQVLAGAFVDQPCGPQPRVAAAGGFVETVSCERRVVLPDTLELRAELAPEMRQRGLFRVPVYRAEIDVVARFTPDDLAGVGADERYAAPRIGLALSDLGGVQAIDALSVNGVPRRAEPGADPFGGLATLMVPLRQDEAARPLEIRYRLALAGTDRIALAPIARVTDAAIAGAWPDPSFDGTFLPAARTVGPERFEARWQVPVYSRAVPQAGLASAYGEVAASAFGVSFFDAASVYRLNDRAAKYGLLVIALIFTALFLFEVLSGLRVHAVQYVLVGLALATFYLLLLAASEHLGFGLAYLAAALAAVTIVGGYAAASLRGWRRGAAVGALQGAAYGVFYVLVANDTYALLLGALTLFAAVAVAMYLTRRVDWYGGMSASTAPARGA